MSQLVEKKVLPFAMTILQQGEQLLYWRWCGASQPVSGQPIDAETPLRVYSMTKPITGVALMMLYEEGKFRLNDPVAMYIPELANLEVALSTAGTGVVSDGTVSRGVGESKTELFGQTRKPARQPTVRDLMLHTAGFTYGVFGNTEVITSDLLDITYFYWKNLR